MPSLRRDARQAALAEPCCQVLPRAHWRKHGLAAEPAIAKPLVCLTRCAFLAFASYRDRRSRLKEQRLGSFAPYGARGALASLPATLVPEGTDAAGLPMGVQVVGAWLHDMTTLAVAQRIAG